MSKMPGNDDAQMQHQQRKGNDELRLVQLDFLPPQRRARTSAPRCAAANDFSRASPRISGRTSVPPDHCKSCARKNSQRAKKNPARL